VLLLVLIFVLVAFGLLLVALVTGTAAWAWISVVVSVAAAGALVYDWAQRRAAVKTGAGERAPRGQFAAPTNMVEPPTTAIPVMGGAVTDPPTEVFAAIRPNSGVGPSVADAPETVAIPAVPPPSGSPDRPSSAVPDGSQSGDAQSPSVTSASRDRSNVPNSGASSLTGDNAGEKAPSESGKSGDRIGGVAAGAAGAAAAAAAGAVAAGASAARSAAKGREAEPAEPDDRARDDRATDDRARDSRATDGRPAAGSPADARPVDAERGTDRSETSVGGPAEPDRSAKTGEPAETGEPAKSDGVKSDGVKSDGVKSDGTGREARTEADAAPRDARTSAGAESDGDNGSTTVFPTVAAAGAAAAAQSGVRTPEDAPGEPTRAGRPDDDDGHTAVIPRTDDTADGAPVRESAPREPVEAAAAADGASGAQANPPVQGGPPPEPDEERTSPAAEAIVATLSEEVAVIDEQPRFHLLSCRLLAGNETIPLPAKEAVEYGFTPCAVCSPVRTLAARNRAASSS
jgi:hypothetical protein